VETACRQPPSTLLRSVANECCRNNCHAQRMGRHWPAALQPERLAQESPGQRPGEKKQHPGSLQPERPAQESPGQRPGSATATRDPALKGRHKPHGRTAVAPFQGSTPRTGRTPRALPWAILWRPFRALERAIGSAQRQGFKERHGSYFVSIPKPDSLPGIRLWRRAPGTEVSGATSTESSESSKATPVWRRGV
jgi:hypothetical protein